MFTATIYQAAAAPSRSFRPSAKAAPLSAVAVQQASFRSAVLRTSGAVRGSASRTGVVAQAAQTGSVRFDVQGKVLLRSPQSLPARPTGVSCTPPAAFHRQPGGSVCVWRPHSAWLLGQTKLTPYPTPPDARQPARQHLEITDALRDYAQKKIGHAVEQFARSDGVREVRKKSLLSESTGSKTRAPCRRISARPHETPRRPSEWLHGLSA